MKKFLILITLLAFYIPFLAAEPTNRNGLPLVGVEKLSIVVEGVNENEKKEGSVLGTVVERLDERGGLDKYYKRIEGAEGRLLEILNLEEFFPYDWVFVNRGEQGPSKELSALRKAQDFIEKNYPNLIARDEHNVESNFHSLRRLMSHIAEDIHFDYNKCCWKNLERPKTFTVDQDFYNNLLRRFLRFNNTPYFKRVVDICLSDFRHGRYMGCDSSYESGDSPLNKRAHQLLLTIERNYLCSQEEGYSYAENAITLQRNKRSIHLHRALYHFSCGITRRASRAQKNLEVLLSVWPFWRGRTDYVPETLIRHVWDMPTGILKNVLEKVCRDNDLTSLSIEEGETFTLAALQQERRYYNKIFLASFSLVIISIGSNIGVSFVADTPWFSAPLAVILSNIFWFYVCWPGFLYYFAI